MRDSFLKDLSNTGIEFFLSIHVQPIDKDEALTEILQKTVAVKGDIAETILKLSALLSVINIFSHESGNNPEEIFKSAKFMMTLIDDMDSTHFNAMKG